MDKNYLTSSYLFGLAPYLSDQLCKALNYFFFTQMNYCDNSFYGYFEYIFYKVCLNDIDSIWDPWSIIFFLLCHFTDPQTVAPYGCRIPFSKKACQNFAIIIINNLCYCRVCILQKTYFVTVLYPFKVWFVQKTSFRCRKVRKIS